MPSNRNRTRIWLMAVLAPGLLLRLVIACREVNELTLRVLPDDAFYYFVIARNIAAGHGSTFDLLAPTNGYHPLWMALITPFFALLPGRQAPVSAALILASLIARATAWLLYLVLRRLGLPRAAAVAGAAAWFYSPMSIQFSLNGLETAVATGAALLVYVQFLRIRSLGGGVESPQSTEPRWGSPPDWRCWRALTWCSSWHPSVWSSPGMPCARTAGVRPLRPRCSSC